MKPTNEGAVEIKAVLSLLNPRDPHQLTTGQLDIPESNVPESNVPES